MKKRFYKNIGFYLLTVSLSITGISCNKLLERPVVEIQEPDVFTNISYTVQYVSDIYGSLPNPLSPVAGTLYEPATDDAKFGNVTNNVYRLATGAWDANFNPDDKYNVYYTAIRKCNNFFENINQLPVKDHGVDIVINGQTATVVKAQLRGEVFFLRAFFYAELLKRYGGVPLVLKTFSLNDNINLPRNGFDEVMKSLSDDCDSAFNTLPATYLSAGGGGVNVPSYYGRATKWVAQALKARALLYAASPLFNPANDAAKWQNAAAAAKPFFDGTAPFPLSASFANLFIGNTSANTEIIWARVTPNSNALEVQNYPVGFSGQGFGVCPSQNLVDAFEMNNGKPITDPSSGYNPASPYTNRDARLAASIIYNGVTFNGRTIQTYTGGVDGPDKTGGSLTSYYMKKLVSPSLNLVTGQTAQHNAIFFRSAEMLLNYAEALNESNASPVADVYTAVNRVRQRTGIAQPALPAGLTQAQMRDRIRNERRVEFCFEGFRYWDARRWDIAKTVFNGPLTGMQVTQNGSTVTYTPYTVEQHVFLPKMNLYPVNIAERQANPNLTQTPGW